MGVMTVLLLLFISNTLTEFKDVVWFRISSCLSTFRSNSSSVGRLEEGSLQKGNRYKWSMVSNKGKTQKTFSNFVLAWSATICYLPKMMSVVALGFDLFQPFLSLRILWATMPFLGREKPHLTLQLTQ